MERRGIVRAEKVLDVKATTLVPFIERTIAPNSVVYTDDLPSYNRLGQMGYDHKSVPHSQKIYVIGDIHTNSIEGFWSLVKRGINGVYHSVGSDYLQSYVNEYSFRYNRRNSSETMFEAFLGRVVASGQGE